MILNILKSIKLKVNSQIKGNEGKNVSRDNRVGKDGGDLYYDVPLGTRIFSYPEKELLYDLYRKNDTYLLCKGGSAGKGNGHHRSVKAFTLKGENRK